MQKKWKQKKATHGMLFFREMDVETFLDHASELEKSMEGVNSQPGGY